MINLLSSVEEGKSSTWPLSRGENGKASSFANAVWVANVTTDKDTVFLVKAPLGGESSFQHTAQVHEEANKSHSHATHS